MVQNAVSTTHNPKDITTLVSNPRARLERLCDGKISIFLDGNYFSVNEDEIGHISDERKNEWLEHFVKYYDELLKKDEEKKDFYKKAELAVKGSLKQVRNWYDNILAMFGVRRFNDIQGDYAKKKEAQGYYAQICDLKSDAIGFGNRYFSACLSAFMHACDKGKYV